MNHNKISIILVRIPDFYDLNPKLELFAAGIKNKCLSFRRLKDRLSAFASELLKLKILTDYCSRKDSCTYASIINNKFGKPFIKFDPHLKFNISHSGDYVIIAISYKYDIGIDIEKIEQLNNVNDLAKVFCSDVELELINDDIMNFYLLWSKKESYFKMLGTGLLTKDLKNTSFCLSDFEEYKGSLIYASRFDSNYVLSISVNSLR